MDITNTLIDAEESGRLSAEDVMEMLGVEVGDILAHGYTHDRQTIEISFDYASEEPQFENKDLRGELPDGVTKRIVLVRLEGDEQHTHEESEFFEAAWFFQRVKRWYDPHPHYPFNPRLKVLLRTFCDTELPTVASSIK